MSIDRQMQHDTESPSWKLLTCPLNRLVAVRRRHEGVPCMGACHAWLLAMQHQRVEEISKCGCADCCPLLGRHTPAIVE